MLTVVNQDPVPLGGDAYPAAGRVSFVVYWTWAPRDAAGNTLNAIAATFSEQQITGGSSGSGGSGTTAPGSTAPGSTAPGSGGGGGGSSGGCALAPSGPDSRLPWLAFAALLGGLVLLRRP